MKSVVAYLRDHTSIFVKGVRNSTKIFSEKDGKRVGILTTDVPITNKDNSIRD